MSLSEVKKMLRKITLTAIGNAKGSNSGVLAYGMTLNTWNVNTSAWDNIVTGTSNTIETKVITLSSNLGNYVTPDQKIYLLVRATYASNGSIASELLIDYLKADVEMSDQIDFVKSNIVTVTPEQKEIKLMFPAISYRTGILDQVSLNYRYIPRQGEQLGVVDKELTKPSMYYLSTIGTGAYSTENRSLLWQLLGSTSDYLGQSLHTFMSKGIKQLLFEVDMMASKPIVNGNFVVMASKVVVKNSQLYLRVYYKESKNLGTYVDLSNASYVDFMVSGRPLVKNN
jgi:hypothetical protein